MAKRFGRNQRRHMREEIATKNELLSEALNRSAARGREAAELRARLERWAADVMRLMGDDSAFNERAKRMSIDDSYAAYGELRLSPSYDLGPIGPRAAPPMMVQTIITALIWRLHMSRDEFRPMIRIELENRFKEPVGYALAEDHRWTERDIEYLSRRIATEMATLLNSVDKPRRRA